MDLLERLESVGDRDSFLDFVEALASDWTASAHDEGVIPSAPFGQAAGGWENVTVGSFLSAASAWARDTSVGVEPGAEPSWRSLAEFLYAGKVYE